MSVSPAQESACRSNRRTMPTSLPALRARAVPARRVIQRPPCIEPRSSSRVARMPVPTVRPRKERPEREDSAMRPILAHPLHVRRITRRE
ncbi:hypothetical protein V2I01_16805 [Micromonospora sp. BRA006-A]|nr:hypothetical protein [Micromonospora sp. BRA006-A]